MAPLEEDNKLSKIFVYGLLIDAGFHQASLAADYINQKYPEEFTKPEKKGFLECDWLNFLDNLKKEKRDEVWAVSSSCIVFINDQLCADNEAFLELAKDNYGLEEFRPLPFFHALAKEEYKRHLLENKHEYVYLTIASENGKGKLIIELFNDKCPKTCENFRELCVGGRVEAKRHDPPCMLSYKSSIIHRIVKNGWIQGGDIVAGKGDGGESIHGEYFPDENFSVPHDKRGIIGMVNKGPHTNSSQFYITLQAAPWMDRKYVAFGQIIEGAYLIDTLENQDTYNERPQKEWKVIECGIIDVENDM